MERNSTTRVSFLLWFISDPRLWDIFYVDPSVWRVVGNVLQLIGPIVYIYFHLTILYSRWTRQIFYCMYTTPEWYLRSDWSRDPVVQRTNRHYSVNYDRSIDDRNWFPWWRIRWYVNRPDDITKINLIINSTSRWIWCLFRISWIIPSLRPAPTTKMLIICLSLLPRDLSSNTYVRIQTQITQSLRPNLLEVDMMNVIRFTSSAFPPLQLKWKDFMTYRQIHSSYTLILRKYVKDTDLILEDREVSNSSIYRDVFINYNILRETRDTLLRDPTRFL